jgi:hypothetical protein
MEVTTFESDTCSKFSKDEFDCSTVKFDIRWEPDDVLGVLTP